VTFATEDAANAAVENLDGLEVDGRGIRVNLAQPRNSF
jgi:RNA recognition motif-containing protein